MSCMVEASGTLEDPVRDVILSWVFSRWALQLGAQRRQVTGSISHASSTVFSY